MYLSPDHSLAALPAILALGPLQTGWIGTIIIGFIVGGKEPTGCLITIIIGIVGSAIALFLGRTLGWYHEGEAPGFIASTIGAIVLLVIYHMITRKSGPSA